MHEVVERLLEAFHADGWAVRSPEGTTLVGTSNGERVEVRLALARSSRGFSWLFAVAQPPGLAAVTTFGTESGLYQACGALNRQVEEAQRLLDLTTPTTTKETTCN